VTPTDPKSETASWLVLKDRALDSTAEGITIADATLPGRPLIYANEGFERLTGYPAGEALGRNCKFLQGAETDPATVEEIRAALREERDCTVEILNYRRDGRPFWNRLSISPLRDPKGAVTHFIGIQSDVTERREAEAALRRTQQELKAANARLQEDLDEAVKIQRAWLPHTIPQLEGFQFAWTFQPCQHLAGDGLTLLRLDDRHIGLCVLDVSGHGVPAALLSASLNRWLSSQPEGSCLFIRSPANESDYLVAPPATVASALNRQFRADPETGRFFTMLYGVLDVKSREFIYVTAGHPPPLRVNMRGAEICPAARGLPIGVLDDFEFEEAKVQLAPGDRLFLYTDGAFEATNASDQELGHERLLQEIIRLQDHPLEASLEAIHATVRQWCPGGILQDDVTLVAVDVV